MEIIVGRDGNQKIKITDNSVSRKHCRITKNADGTYTIENLSQNGTKVDGRDIIRATAGLNSIIQLGNRFSTTIEELVGDMFSKSSSRGNFDSIANSPQEASKQQPEVKTFNISHLQRVWDDFNQTNIEKADQQRKINLTRTGLGIFTMCAMPTIFFFGPAGYVLTAIGILGNIYSFVGLKNSETAEDRQRRQDEFDDAWVCPNPECGRTLLAKNYKMLVRNHQSCPYCKCKYVER